MRWDFAAWSSASPNTHGHGDTNAQRYTNAVGESDSKSQSDRNTDSDAKPNAESYADTIAARADHAVDSADGTGRGKPMVCGIGDQRLEQCGGDVERVMHQ